MYWETFYGRRTARQLQWSETKVKKIAFGNKEHTEPRKSETRFDCVSSYATL